MAPFAWHRSAYQSVRLSLPVDNAAVAYLRAAIRDAARGVGFPTEPLYALLVGTAEACSNAIKHGTKGPGRSIEADVHASRDEVTVRLYYASEPFIFGPESNRDESSGNSYLGHTLMREMLDEIQYRFRRGSALLRIVKRA